MKKESLANALLKGAIVGGGALLGLLVSKCFKVEETSCEEGADGETSDIIEATCEEVKEETTEG